MKKALAILLLLSLCLGLCACGGEKELPPSMENYQKRLGSKYEITQLSNNELSTAYASELKLNVGDYEVKSAFKAIHKDDAEKVVIVVECGSADLGLALQDELAANMDVLKKVNGDSFIVSLTDVYVISGVKSAVSDTTGYTYK